MINYSLLSPPTYLITVFHGANQTSCITFSVRVCLIKLFFTRKIGMHFFFNLYGQPAHDISGWLINKLNIF